MRGEGTRKWRSEGGKKKGGEAQEKRKRKKAVERGKGEIRRQSSCIDGRKWRKSKRRQEDKERQEEKKVTGAERRRGTEEKRRKKHSGTAQCLNSFCQPLIRSSLETLHAEANCVKSGFLLPRFCSMRQRNDRWHIHLECSVMGDSCV